jgi:hypothetical protein
MNVKSKAFLAHDFKVEISGIKASKIVKADFKNFFLEGSRHIIRCKCCLARNREVIWA